MSNTNKNSLVNKTGRYLFDVLGITKHANFHLGTRNVWQLDRAAETLVLLWIVVLQPNLEFDGLHKFAILLLGIGHDSGDSFSQGITLKLTTPQASNNKSEIQNTIVNLVHQ